MQYLPFKIKKFIPFLLVSMILMCESNIPIRDLTRTHSAIHKAECVDAQLHSKENYLEAKKNYLKAHDEIILNENIEKGLEYIKKSIEFSEKAYEEAKEKALVYWGNKLKDNFIKMDRLCIKIIDSSNYNKFKKRSGEVEKNLKVDAKIVIFRNLNKDIENLIQKVSINRTEIDKTDDILLKNRIGFFNKIKNYNLIKNYTESENKIIYMEKEFKNYLNKEDLCSAIINIQRRRKMLYLLNSSISRERTVYVKNKVNGIINHCNVFFGKINILLKKNKDKFNSNEELKYNNNLNFYYTQLNLLQKKYNLTTLKFNKKNYGFSRKNYCHILSLSQISLLNINNYYTLLEKKVSGFNKIAKNNLEKSNEIPNVKISQSLNKKVSVSKKKKILAGFIEVYFSLDRYKLNKKQFNKMKKFLQKVDPQKIAFIRIKAHSDQQGSNSYNFKLSQKRGDDIVKILTKYGYPSNKIEMKNFGEEDPLFLAAKYFHLNRYVKISVYFE